MKMTNLQLIISHMRIYIKEKEINPNLILDSQLLHMKERFERLIHDFPVEPISTYEKARAEIHDPAKESKVLEIDSIIEKKTAQSQKSYEMAKAFLNHTAFKVDISATVRIIANGKLLPQPFALQTYKDILEKYEHKGKTFWEIFDESILHGATIYDPFKEQYFFSETNHCFLNTYIPPDWKSCGLQPKEYKGLSPILRGFLEHLFPTKSILKHVLKWCAYSTKINLQTYLTLIGQPGIGKTIFVQDFMAYYHGIENLNIVQKIDTLTTLKNLNSTLFYLDEMTMNELEQYNILKKFTNDLVGNTSTKKNVQNFSNIIWSSNTKNAMSALGADDRRFKIVPITDKILNADIKVFDDAHPETKIFEFSPQNIMEFKNDVSLKNDLVSHFLHILRTEKDINDINAIEDNYQKEEVIVNSRSEDFRQLFDVLTNIKNDFDFETKSRISLVDYTPRMFQDMGTPFKDFVPLTSLAHSKDSRYMFRIPFQVIKNVIDIKKEENFSNMTYFRFYNELEKMPPSLCKARCVKGQTNFDLEINLPNFDPEMLDIFHKYHFRFAINGDPTIRIKLLPY